LKNSGKPVLGMILKGYPRIHLFSMRKPRENFSHASVKNIKAKVDYLPESLFVPLPRFLYFNFKLALKSPRVYADTFKIALKRFRRTHKPATFKHLLQAGYLIQRLIPGSGVSHLHAHFAHSPTSVALFARQLGGIPFSFTAHAKDVYISHPEQLSEKISLACFVVTCTEYNKRHLMKLSGNEKTSIHRIYHGIDMDLFSGNLRNTSPKEPYQILTVARMIPKKGLPTVYRALQHLKNLAIPFHHTLIGDGEDCQKILSLIKGLGLNSTTTWLKTQPHEVVLKHYRRADLFALGCEVTPDGDRDGIPNVFLECMAMGVPIVTTRVSAIPELIEDSQTGLLVPPGRPEPMARAMLTLLTDMDLRKRIIPAARDRVKYHFDNKTLISDLADLFKAQGL
jgi:glycosyltransferase involved in cell wall biosynthesis